MSHDDEFELQVQVRYAECDSMNVAHHAAYPVWLEMARTEMLRRRGTAYRDLEAAGVFFVVVRMAIRYRRPARYDDVLTIRTRLVRADGVKLEHEYEIRRHDEVLATAQTTLACVDREGKLQRVPEHLTRP